MHGTVSFNGGLQDARNPRLPALSAAGLYGRGIFTTVAIYNGEPFLWEKHWRRLTDHGERVAIGLDEFTENGVRDSLDELIAANSIQDGRARVTFFDESPTDLWEYDAGRRTSVLIATASLSTKPEAFPLTISPYHINTASPLTGVKSCNYLEKLMAKQDAKRRGFDEGVQLNERGEIVSACMANIFWVNDGKLFTPSLRSGCLAGTTREFVMDNLDCEEREASIEEFRGADQIFLTSAGLGISRVSQLDNRHLVRKGHEILSLLPTTV